jgi:adenine-specific DNA-methyltransferase
MVDDKEAIILDSFAGSGTTAHAVLALNKQDGGNRKFILVECEDYADDITAERVRRVIKGIPDARDEDLKNGLGGGFGYYTLGEELNIENLITGKSIPDYDSLARHVTYTATGVTLDNIRSGKDYFFGETNDYCLYMIYRPDLTFLRSAESALTLSLAERIGKAAQQKSKAALVFAPWKFVSQKDLSKQKITFCQLPYAIHRLLGD